MTITGAHVLLYTTDPDSDRAFFRDVLGFRWVDAGRGWLIFGLPPSELALHPIDNPAAPADTASAVLYLMCDDVEAFVGGLESRGIDCDPVKDQGWGLLTAITLPGGGKLVKALIHLLAAAGKQ